MANTHSFNQHLEMLLQKRSRCEDWVASIAASQEDTLTSFESSDHQDADYVDDYPETSENIIGGKRRQRKGISNAHSELELVCKWDTCVFRNKATKQFFVQHVMGHIINSYISTHEDGNSTYKCLWHMCNHESLEVAEIKRHLSMHAFRAILTANALELHKFWDVQECPLNGESRNLIPVSSSSFHCKAHTCEFSTDNYYDYVNHVEVHVNQLNFNNGREIKCIWRECCTFKCKRKVSMRIHLRSHTGEKVLACPTCGATFATNTKYRDHCERKTTYQDESNQCQFCLRFYPNERLLRDHMRYHINSHKCSFCEMTFSTPSVLANHVRHKHLNSKPFECEQCSFKCVKAYDYYCHLTVHESEPRFKCQEHNCQFSSRSIMSLKKHYVSDHLKESGPIYKCHLCEKEYNRGASLGTHLRSIHKLERLPGHSRFRYMENKDGYFRLQVERYESLELNNIKPNIMMLDPEGDQKVTVTSDNCQNVQGFFVTVQDKVIHSTIITIDELDEQGNVIRSSTVNEVLLRSLPENAEILVKTTDGTPDEDPLRLDFQDSETDSIKLLSPITSRSNSVAERGSTTIHCLRKRKQVKLSSSNVKNDPDIIIRRD